MLFGYEHMVDVGNVTEYTLKDLVAGQKYFFAAIAYDDDGNRSVFSVELNHTFQVKPKGPKEFKKISNIQKPAELAMVDKTDGSIIIDGINVD
jgi:hypothetical protein